MSEYNTVEKLYNGSSYDKFYKETYEPMVTNKVYFSGNAPELVKDLPGILALPILNNIIHSNYGLAPGTGGQLGRVEVSLSGTYLVSARVYVSDSYGAKFNVAIRRNNNDPLCESMSFSCQMPRNMEGYNPGDGWNYGRDASLTNVSGIVHLDAGDSLYLTMQSNATSGLRRFNSDSGMEIFLLQADL